MSNINYPEAIILISMVCACAWMFVSIEKNRSGPSANDIYMQMLKNASKPLWETEIKRPCSCAKGTNNDND